MAFHASMAFHGLPWPLLTPAFPALFRASSVTSPPRPRPPSARPRQAVGDLQSSKSAYVDGFSPQHPKVAWALEGLAKVYRKLGSLSEAQLAVDEALLIRRAIQVR